MDEALRFSWSDVHPISADLPGSGGRIREQLDDFVVEEVPSYLPQGRGSHTYLLVRKRGRTTRDLVTALLAEGLNENQIGVAGLKDKWAVTEQWISLPHRHAAAAAALERLDGVTVLEESRHKNKLGIGHLRGNRFSIRIRGCDAGAAERADAVVRRLREVGAPNYFGPQRFGRFGSNAVDGVRLLRGERVPGGLRLKRFFVAALQSRLFNALLARRMELNLYRDVVVGDWAKKHDTGGMFSIDDDQVRADASERAHRLELSAALPLYGRKVRSSAGRAGSLEAEVFGHFGLSWIDFASRRGDRRASRIRLEALEVLPYEDGLTLRFFLPKGSYATPLLREIMKVEVDAPTAQAGIGDPASHAAVDEQPEQPE